MTDTRKTYLSPRARVLVVLLSLLFPLMVILSHQVGKMQESVEGLSCQVDVLACEARLTEVVMKCWGDAAKRLHYQEQDFELSDPARFGEGE